MRIVLLLLLLFVSSFVLVVDCATEGLARVYSREEYIANFRELTSQFFVGQQDAFDATLVALQRFRPKTDVLILHYVGASGTGKTLLANLVQRSFFSLKQCTGGITIFGKQFCWPGGKLVNTFGGLQLHMIGTKTYGVAYADFLNTENSYVTHKQVLENTLHRALEHSTDTAHQPTIVFLDNFNLCKLECEQLMSKITVEQRFESQELHGVVFLITSDLSQEGLRLVSGEDRVSTLQRVLQVVEDTWGEQSLWNDRAHVVPFAPYPDTDLLKIFDFAVRDVEREVKMRLEDRLEEECDMRRCTSIKWTGRFKFAEREKQAVMNKLYREITQRNARAFEKVKGKFLAAIRRPVPIEDVLITRYEPVEAETWLLKDLWRYAPFDPKAKLLGLEYQQDIVFKSVDDARFVVVEVDDIHAFYGKNKQHQEL